MSKKKILIVEDEESLLKLESILLTSKGFEVKGVSDGQAALDAIAEEHPDLVLLDIMLPEIDGFEVCRRIKSEPGYPAYPGHHADGQKKSGGYGAGGEGRGRLVYHQAFQIRHGH